MTAPDRRALALQIWTDVFGTPPVPPDSPVGDAMFDFGCAEVWARDGLMRRDRRLLTLACITSDALAEPVRAVVRSTLASGDATVAELHEVALHLAAYVGFPAVSSVLRGAITAASAELGLTTPEFARSDEHGAERRQLGRQVQETLRGGSVADPVDPLGEASFDFVAAEVWSRPGLSWRDRRLLSLASVVRAALPRETSLHVRSALESGDLTVDELQEVSLHLAVYLGFPRALALQRVVRDVTRALCESS